MKRVNDEMVLEPMQSDSESETYRILFLEDNPDDVEFMEHELRDAGILFQSSRVDSKRDFLNAIQSFYPDVILADYSLSMFNGMQAYRMLKKDGPTVPFILVTGVLSEKLALECLKEGVDDFVLKSSFKRLPAAIMGAIKKKRVEEEKTRIAVELRKSHSELRLLLSHHQASVEQERMTIARDLHDELGQVLTALKIDIVMLWKKLTVGQLSEQQINDEFKTISGTVDKITQSVKEISSGLRPETLDELGILEAIRSQAFDFERRSQIPCQLSLPKDPFDISKELSIAVFRIVQEALTNVARHSLATLAHIYLEKDDRELFLEIQDNGRGIKDDQVKSSKSLGLIGLRERVKNLDGHFRISGPPTGGTKISVVIPLGSSLKIDK